MSPTLAMAVEREMAITAFQPETFYQIQLTMDGFTALSDRMKSQEEANKWSSACQNEGTVTVEKMPCIK